MPTTTVLEVNPFDPTAEHTSYFVVNGSQKLGPRVGLDLAFALGPKEDNLITDLNG